MKVSERIKSYRKDRRMTLEELGSLCGQSYQTIYKYEKGFIKNIPLDTIEKMADAFGVTPANLMGWDTENTLHPSENPVPITLTESETALIETYRTLSPEGQQYITTQLSIASAMFPQKNHPVSNSEIG